MLVNTKESAIKHFEDYINELRTCKLVEQTKSYQELYELHIERAEKQLNKLKGELNIDDILKFLDEETHSYGWSFLPDKHGERAESSFYHLRLAFTGE